MPIEPSRGAKGGMSPEYDCEKVRSSVIGDRNLFFVEGWDVPAIPLLNANLVVASRRGRLQMICWRQDYSESQRFAHSGHEWLLKLIVPSASVSLAPPSHLFPFSPFVGGIPRFGLAGSGI
eukprot:166519-Rhodomonas_salina.1